jgi:hypothetical protein
MVPSYKKPSVAEMPILFSRFANRNTRSVALLLVMGSCPPISSSQSQPAAGSQETDATAARKKKFAEDKQRLENGGVIAEDARPDPDQTLFVSPFKASMVVGESRTFSVFDIDGRVLTAETEWSVSDSTVAEIVEAPIQAITAKSVGTFTLHALVGRRSAEATVTVYPGPKFPPTTVRWLAPPIPGFTLQKVMPGGIGVGPDGIAVSFAESDGHGGILLRAFTSDGRQIWMKRVAALPNVDSRH